MALLVVVYRESADPLLLGLVGGARVLPYVFLSVPAGVVADRFDRRLILLTTDVARGLIMVVLTILQLSGGPLWAIVGLAIFATCFSTFAGPAMGAYVPMLVRDERELGPANSLFATLAEVSFIIGPAIAGLIIAAADLGVAFALNAVTFVVIAAVLATLPPGRPGTAVVGGEEPVAGDDGAPVAREPLMTSLQPILRPLAGMVALDVAAGVMFGGLSVLTVLLSVDRLGAGEEGTGFLNAAVGVGGVVGAIGSGAIVLRPNLTGPMLAGGIILGGGFALLGFSTSLPPALLAVGLCAAGSILVDVVTTTIFQHLVPDVLRGRVIGALQTIQTATFIVGSALLPVAASTLGAAVVLPIGGAVIVGAAVLAVVLLGSHLRQAPDAATEQLVRISNLPIFAGVPPAALTAAAAKLEPVPVTAGTAVVTQGEPADRFYVIERGTFAVDRAEAGGGAQRLRELGPDDVFGELGLLDGAPRSATVTAETDGQVLALDGPDFLELVGAAGELSNRMRDRYRGAGTAA